VPLCLPELHRSRMATMTGPLDPPVSTAPEWTMTCAREGNIVRVSVGGDLDLATAPRLDGALREIESTSSTVILDLSGLTFIDSSGINLLVRHAERARSNGFALSIVPPNATVARVLDITGVDQHLPLAE
jgi:anti-sigma B factor antagonist